MQGYGKERKGRLLQAAVWLPSVLFLFDDIMGTNGYQLTIAGVSIRIIWFFLSVLSLCLYSLWVMKQERISLLPGKKGSLWQMFTVMDWALAAFLVGNALWATVIPLLVRGNMQFGLKDFSTVITLALYFPLAFLIRTGRLSLKKLEKLLYIFALVLAGWHCLMYVGESLWPGFYPAYYTLIEKLSMGTAVMSQVVYGFGIVRVIQTTSLFLLPGAFLSLRYAMQGKRKHLAAMLLFTFAICATFTKSIWFGYLFGMLLYLGAGALLEKNRQLRIRAATVAVAALLMVVVLNYTVFQNQVFVRGFNTVRTTQSVQLLQSKLDKANKQPASATDESTGETTETVTETTLSEKELEKLRNELRDALGTQEANSQRAAQNGALLNKWKQSPILGHGYGAYAEELIRNDQYPFMYESTLPALLMKLGGLGLILWAVFVMAVTFTAWQRFYSTHIFDFFWWLGMALSFGLAVQTNPFLFTIPGFSILLYLMVSLQEKKTLRS